MISMLLSHFHSKSTVQKPKYDILVCVCVCVCVRARARVCVCVRVWKCAHTQETQLRISQVLYLHATINRHSSQY